MMITSESHIVTCSFNHAWSQSQSHGHWSVTWSVTWSVIYACSYLFIIQQTLNLNFQIFPILEPIIHSMKLCPSTATSTMFAKPLTSISELCGIFGGASTKTLLGQWLARWSVHGSIIVTRFSTERLLETSVKYRGWSTRWREWFPVLGSVITSHLFWLNCTGFQSRPEFASKLPCRHTRRSPRRNRNISPIYSTSRLHRDHSGQAQGTVFMLTLPGLASLVALFVMRRRLFGTLFPFTWQIFRNR